MFERVGGGVVEAVVLQRVPRSGQPQSKRHNTQQTVIFLYLTTFILTRFNLCVPVFVREAVFAQDMRTVREGTILVIHFKVIECTVLMGTLKAIVMV